MGNIYLLPLYLEDTSANHKLDRVTRSQIPYYVLVNIKAYGSLILNFHLQMYTKPNMSPFLLQLV